MIAQTSDTSSQSSGTKCTITYNKRKATRSVNLTVGLGLGLVRFNVPLDT